MNLGKLHQNAGAAIVSLALNFGGMVSDATAQQLPNTAPKKEYTVDILLEDIEHFLSYPLHKQILIARAMSEFPDFLGDKRISVEKRTYLQLFCDFYLHQGSRDILRVTGSYDYDIYTKLLDGYVPKQDEMTGEYIATLALNFSQWSDEQKSFITKLSDASIQDAVDTIYVTLSESDRKLLILRIQLERAQRALDQGDQE